jgi:hypothetical protein
MITYNLSRSEQRFIRVWSDFILSFFIPLSTFALIQVELFVWVEFSYFLNWFLLGLFLVGILMTGISLVRQILYFIRFDFRELWYVVFVAPLNDPVVIEKPITSNHILP